jgi:hypothetical protein
VLVLWSIAFAAPDVQMAQAARLIRQKNWPFDRHDKITLTLWSIHTRRHSTCKPA